ncbi:MAG: nucleotidyltransferase [Stomatobaculum sp.]|jgi:dTDP-glucose pyrophosphorylase|nr:nucleotidyltransferase [Stomatobaculum sp.]
MKTTLVVMAAGIGSRFGGGIKQLEPMGPNGEIIMDYSAYDARRAGFDKAVFIIRKEIEAEFRDRIGKRIEKVMDVDYAYQELDAIPAGFSVPEGRKKPWGTGHAVLCAKGKTEGSCIVINADDYYGPEGFRAVHDYLAREKAEGGAETGLDMCMAGFVLKNTLSENGTVNRGICDVSAEGFLNRVEETYEIGYRRSDCRTVLGAKDGAGKDVPVHENQLCSMNMWGLPERFFDVLEEEFPRFLESVKPGDLKAEYMLPVVIDECIHRGLGTVRVLPTHDKWFGVTYKEDKPAVVAAVRKLIADGLYPEALY